MCRLNFHETKQGRKLSAGDHLALGECDPRDRENFVKLPNSILPSYPTDWNIFCIAGPQDDDTFITPHGRGQFYKAKWTVTTASNRMGIRLDGPKMQLARKDGGEGGSHPSNILDNGYAQGSINLNGDTPVILTKEGKSGCP